MLDPPGFSPEDGEPIRDRDTDTEFSRVAGVQFPIPVQPKRFVWQTVGVNLRAAHRENEELVAYNPGPVNLGFHVCAACGAAWPVTDQQDASWSPKDHARPFLIDSWVLNRENTGRLCKGPLHTAPVVLGHAFRTDLLLLRLTLKSPFVANPQHTWLTDALQTLADAVALAASRWLDVDPGELSAGFRFLPPNASARHDAATLVDIYLFDTASGGAGYAAEAAEDLPAVLDLALDLLTDCPADCERSCTSCLRHYGNRFVHHRLDRRLGIDLVTYIRTGRLPAEMPTPEQARMLEPLARYLSLEGWTCRMVPDSPQSRVPLRATAPSGGRSVSIGLWPALRDPAQVLERGAAPQVLLLNEYKVARDLPTVAFDVESAIR